MSKIFYYDLGTVDATLTEGTWATDTWTAGASITDENLLNDNSIGAAASAITAGDGAMFDMGAAISPTIAAIYIASGSDNLINIYASASAANGAKTSIAGATCSVGWNFIVISGSYRYWFFKVSGTFTISEIFIGGTYTFATRYDLGFSQSKIHGIDVDRSYGNVKGSNKRHDELMTWSWTWGTVSEADKANLITLKTQSM